ncbi:hypothetical protein GCM10009601_06640 [Streptomyces thermospinosisporus]|uniref:Uncharacterized protein n=1 Tax=Streptomyces thermospinosisporus TaxID=161482 RepID=A0ABN1YJQ3_9ACTN
MAHTFDEIVAKQRAADAAHARVRHLQETYGPPTEVKWSEQQTAIWETAWRAWRDLARDVHVAVSEYARQEDIPRKEVETRVREAVLRSAEPGSETPGAETPGADASGTEGADGSEQH